VAHVVGPADLGQGLAALAALDGLAPLVGRELRPAAELHAAGLRSRSSFAGASQDQFSLELDQTAKDGEHQAAMWRRRVRTGVAEGTEARPFLGH